MMSNRQIKKNMGLYTGMMSNRQIKKNMGLYKVSAKNRDEQKLGYPGACFCVKNHCNGRNK